jgi:hypothetical protein
MRGGPELRWRGAGPFEEKNDEKRDLRSLDGGLAGRRLLPGDDRDGGVAMMDSRELEHIRNGELWRVTAVVEVTSYGWNDWQKRNPLRHKEIVRTHHKFEAAARKAAGSNGKLEHFVGTEWNEVKK